MARFFLSYRREDASGYAGRVYDRLVKHFGKGKVFMDVADLGIGEDFVEEIRQTIDTSDALIVLIGEEWIDARKDDGRRRLEDPDDFVRVEVATALRRKMPVIPVLLGAARMPKPEDLPDDLKDLVRRNALEISHTRFNYDVDQLVQALDKKFPIHEFSKIKKWLRIAVVAATAIVGGIAIVIIIRERGTTSPSSQSVRAKQINPNESVAPKKSAQVVRSPTSKTKAEGANVSASQFVVKGNINPETGFSFRGQPIVAVIWHTDKGKGDTSFIDQMQVDGMRFEVKYNAPPPDDMIFIIEGVRVGVGALAVLDDVNQDGVAQKNELVGGSPTHMITYLDGDLRRAFNQIGQRPDTLMQLPQGYALTRASPPQERGKSGGFDDLIPVENKIIRLIVPKDRTKIRFPNWT